MNAYVISQASSPEPIFSKTETEAPNNEHTRRGLNCEELRKLECHKNFSPPTTQEDYYKSQGSPEDILRYVALQGKTFGEKHMERIAREYFNLENRITSTHDHSKCKKTIEQKSARWHANGADWKWQHIEMKHPWDFLLLTGLDIHEVKFYIAPRSKVAELIEMGIVTGQGKKNNKGVAEAQQAYWFSRSDFKRKNAVFENYFKQIFCEQDLLLCLN